MSNGKPRSANCFRAAAASIFLFACFLSPQFLLIGAPNDEDSSLNSQAIIRAEVALVNIVVTATDSYGRRVSGLKADDFFVFDNKQQQRIEYFGELGKSSEVPLTIALLIDTSGSVKDKLDYEKQTTADFFRKTLRPQKDRALIMQFDSEVNLVQDLTQNQDALLKALDVLKAGNSTSLYDAVYTAAEEKLKYERGRKVMVIISDGDDNASMTRREAAIRAAQRNDVLIYGIGVQTPNSSFGALKKFAEETGGAFFSPHARREEIQAAFSAIREDIRGQYSLAYAMNAEKDGAFHKLYINSKFRGLRIRAREGYYAPKPAGSKSTDPDS